MVSFRVGLGGSKSEPTLLMTRATCVRRRRGMVVSSATAVGLQSFCCGDRALLADVRQTQRSGAQKERWTIEAFLEGKVIVAVSRRYLEWRI